MSFTSLSFLAFILVVVIINYCIPQRYRWILLLVSSFYFYINWQPVYFLLLLAVSTISFFIGRFLENKNIGRRGKKLILIIGILVPLLSLSIFKYYVFLTENIKFILERINVHIEFPEMKLLLPLGISFYSFTVIGYLIDIYNRKYKPESNFLKFLLFISFFAQISSGPIPRGNHLLPQLSIPDNLSYANIIGGLRTMLWGFFMKLCVADNFSIYVDTVYENLNAHNGGSLLLASFVYTFQIYCDFAGYSLIAIGVAKMLGLQLSDNFRRPYFSRSIKEFWSRWHISLSTWFRDYVYIPLGGNRVSKFRKYFNLMITFLVSGLWHGASWNYILWGGMHGAGQCGEKLNNTIKVPVFFRIFFVFVFVSFCWVFFRLQEISDIKSFFYKIFFDFGVPFMDMILIYGVLAFILLLIKDTVDEFFPKICFMSSSNFWISNIATGLLLGVILLFGVFGGGSFIYFKF